MSRPIAIVVFSLSFGIGAAHGLLPLLPPSWLAVIPSLCWLLLLMTCVMAAWLYKSHTWSIKPSKEPYAFAALTILFFLFLGMGRYAQSYSKVHRIWPRHATYMQGVVTTSPITRNHHTSFVMKAFSHEGALIQIMVWHQGDQEVPMMPVLGEVVAVSGVVRAPRNLGNPDEFDYVRWLSQQGISGTMQVGMDNVAFRGLAPQEEAMLPWMTRLRLQALQQRENLLQRYQKMGFDGETLAVLSAMTLGKRDVISKDLRNLFSDVGAAHLLALSGLHLGIVAALFLALLRGPLICSRWRWLAGLCMLLFVWGFALLTGLPTSLLRASIMMTLLLVAQFLNRTGNSLQHVAVTAIIMLIANPFTLTDVGAQLSFLAVVGIVLFHRPMAVAVSRWWGSFGWKLQRWHVRWIPDLLLVSLSAQMLTWPLVAYYFHRIPTYGIFAGILLIPLTTLLIYAALALLLLHLLGGVFSWGVVLISSLTSFLVGVMRFETSLPCAVIPDFWSRKAEPQVVVYHNRRCPTLHIIASPSVSWLLSPSPQKVEEGLHGISETFWQRRLTERPTLLPSYRTLHANGITIAMLCSKGEQWRPTPLAKTSARLSHKEENRHQIDILWLCQDFDGSLQHAAHHLCPRLVVLDASLPPWVRRRLHAESTALGWPVYDVAESGALKLSLPLQ